MQHLPAKLFRDHSAERAGACMQVRQGFLHVWGDSGPDAAAEATRSPLLLVRMHWLASHAPVLDLWHG